MILSIIIVSYNVKYFLEQCLFSVKKAADGLSSFPDSGIEVIVVDNASSDGTIEYLQDHFPFIHFIVNEENVGFARANNIALGKAVGKYVLFLNPDTILPENIFVDCLKFFESQSSAGAIGVRMIDGNGSYLPESKRGFPTTWRSFCKLSGLSSVFPRSRIFAAYNLGHLDEKGAFVIDALAGAFMMVKKDVLDRVGGFDEQFFMYAEDLDLSKRIQDAGFENYYLGKYTILHFKGESTNKNLQYVHRFYGAMKMYVRKHYKGAGSGLMAVTLNAAIGFRRLFAMISLAKKKGMTPNLNGIHYVGDGEEIGSTKRRLPTIKNDPQAKDWLICEGDEFSFLNLISTIEALPSDTKAMVHAKGSRAVVYSFDRNQRGSAFELHVE
jgi:N-acetylglucosaminyl-diphospho-decaprenol L-rhamnosyltransferase